MQLSEEAIKEYQEIYFKQHGEHISAGEAQIQGLQLIMLLDRMLEHEKDEIKKYLFSNTLKDKSNHLINNGFKYNAEKKIFYKDQRTIDHKELEDSDITIIQAIK